MDNGTIRLLIKKAGVTQQDIASALKMSISTVGKYFNNKPIARRSKFEIERHLDELSAKLSSPDDDPKAA
jgi:transcriptional regulator with XRE-family HTH domain